MEKPTSADREAWLDGLRGVAALIVVWFHMTVGRIAPLYRSFWDSSASGNRYPFQLAPFRILVSGPGMVDTFFVISGYSISISLIKFRNQGFYGQFYTRLASSVFRRVFRLCVPVAVIMLASNLLYYTGLYTMPFAKDVGCPGAEPWGSPTPHIQCFIRSFFGVINLQDDQYFTLNGQLWTIPVEIRGSMYVYLALLGLSAINKRARRSILVLLTIRFWWDGYPQFLAFFVGLLFAELSISALDKDHDLLIRAPPIYNSLPKHAQHRLHPRSVNTFLHCCVFTIGIYLVCLPQPDIPESQNEVHYAPDWFILNWLPPLPWWDWQTTVRTWHTFGAIMVTNSIRLVPQLRRPLESKTAQFLGHISFSLYLCHEAIIRIMLYPSLYWTSFCVSGLSYFDAESEERWGVVFVAWSMSTALIGAVVIMTSRYMTEAVDKRSVQLGFYIEKLMSRS